MKWYKLSDVRPARSGLIVLYDKFTPELLVVRYVAETMRYITYEDSDISVTGFQLWAYFEEPNYEG